jgi:hypothetical protein
MTVNLNQVKQQFGSYSQVELYNNTGGANSAPQRYLTVTGHVSTTVTTRRSGGNTANFNSSSRPGKLKANSLEFFQETVASEIGYRLAKSYSLLPNQYGYYSEISQGVFRDTHNVPSYRLANDGEIAALDAEVRAKLLAQIKNQSINVGQALAERNQTARLIATTATRFAKSIRALRRGDFTSAAEALGVAARKRARSRFNESWRKRQQGAVARGWLELQYGWKPLMNDVYGAAEAVAAHHSNIVYFTARASAKRQIDFDKFLDSHVGDNLQTSFLRTTGKCDYIVKYQVTYYTGDAPLRTAAQLGLTNPALIAWELVPFSFVVDWFLPIGRFIGNLDATLGLEFYSGHRTVFQRSFATSDRIGNGRQYGQDVSFRYGSAIAAVKCSRTILNGFPTVSPPAFKNPVSFTHMANSLALLTQLFRK